MLYAFLGSTYNYYEIFQTRIVGGIHLYCLLFNLSSFYRIFAKLGQNVFGHIISVKFDNQPDIAITHTHNRFMALCPGLPG